MSAPTGVSVNEYLHTSYPDLDREYRDGDVMERSLPDYLHGRTQMVPLVLFAAQRGKLPVFPSSEMRMKLRTGLYLIPDVAVFYPNEPSREGGNVPETPPLIVVEILSADDRWAKVREKLEEFRAWGVKHVWLVDPHGRRMYTCDEGLSEVSRLAVVELGLEVTPKDIFE